MEKMRNCVRLTVWALCPFRLWQYCCISLCSSSLLRQTHNDELPMMTASHNYTHHCHIMIRPRDICHILLGNVDGILYSPPFNGLDGKFHNTRCQKTGMTVETMRWKSWRYVLYLNNYTHHRNITICPRYCHLMVGNLEEFYSLHIFNGHDGRFLQHILNRNDWATMRWKSWWCVLPVWYSVHKTDGCDWQETSVVLCRSPRHCNMTQTVHNECTEHQCLITQMNRQARLIEAFKYIDTVRITV